MIKIHPDTYNTLMDYIVQSTSNLSNPLETTDRWESYVSIPVVKHLLAPREARAILEVFGVLGDYGIKPGGILHKIIAEQMEVK